MPSVRAPSALPVLQLLLPLLSLLPTLALAQCSIILQSAFNGNGYNYYGCLSLDGIGFFADLVYDRDDNSPANCQQACLARVTSYYMFMNAGQWWCTKIPPVGFEANTGTCTSCCGGNVGAQCGTSGTNSFNVYNYNPPPPPPPSTTSSTLSSTSCSSSSSLSGSGSLSSSSSASSSSSQSSSTAETTSSTSTPSSTSSVDHQQQQQLNGIYLHDDAKHLDERRDLLVDIDNRVELYLKQPFDYHYFYR
ncbi:hypothetical protein CPLU01_07094 [Colletotrichum plurivorum]|uniref:WSC domain-containing protein n=1 Tax=Colletotrichum plurivorum TaxID=2175906 RepID=A0A8H6KGI7_9PEZI|nr:hypothetical protein CPLU01_07094 [Colletotrichum plurivorum]